MSSRSRYIQQIWNDSSDSDDDRNSRLLWRSSSESDSSVEGNNFPLERPTRAHRNFRFRLDHLQMWNEEEFKLRFRLNKQTVLMLEGRLGSALESKTKRNQPLSAMQQILLLLRFCATGCMLQSIGDFCGIHKSTVSQIVRKVLKQLVLLSHEYLKMPRNQQEIDSVMKKFHNTAKFPRVVGAIDCTHIKISSPGGNNAEYFRNRKGYFALNVQVIGDSQLYIRDIVARWPGSSHDQTIFSNSYIRARFEAGEFGNSVLIGDSGYSLNRYMMTPIQSPLTEADQLFNEAHVRTRNCIERLFGVWKRRFPILSLGMRLNLETSKSLIVACAVLHNIALEMKEQEPALDVNLTLENEEMPRSHVIDDRRGNFREDFLMYFLNLLERNESS